MNHITEVTTFLNKKKDNIVTYYTDFKVTVMNGKCHSLNEGLQSVQVKGSVRRIYKDQLNKNNFMELSWTVPFPVYFITIIYLYIYWDLGIIVYNLSKNCQDEIFLILSMPPKTINVFKK